MIINIRPSEVKGTVQAPPSKSYAQRAVAVAALAEGGSAILFPGDSDDVKAAVNVARQLGADIEPTENGIMVTGGLRLPDGPLDCGEAGLSIRMFSSIAAVFDQPVTLTGRGSLVKRPMKIIEESLKAMGAECTTSKGFLPVTVKGPLQGGTARIDGSLSSQVLTGILIASALARNDVHLFVDNLQSRPYIDMTIAVMQSFGVNSVNKGYEEFFVKAGQRYTPCRYVVEGDWSGAAFLLVAGAIAGEVRVTNLDNGSPQADRAIIEVLKRAGALIDVSGDGIMVAGGRLNSFEYDATHCPDLFPPVVSLAACCRGRSGITGVRRLIHKESNRAQTLKEEFGKLGIRVDYDDDIMTITGGDIKGGKVTSHGDHRIAMACAVAALAGRDIVGIEGADAVTKSYPRFFDDLELLREKQL